MITWQTRQKFSYSSTVLIIRENYDIIVYIIKITIFNFRKKKVLIKACKL